MTAKYDWLQGYEGAMSGVYGDPNDPNGGKQVVDRIKGVAGKDFDDAVAAGIIGPDGQVDYSKLPKVGPAGFNTPQNTMFAPVGGRVDTVDPWTKQSIGTNVYQDPTFGGQQLVQKRAPDDNTMKLGRMLAIGAALGPISAGIGGGIGSAMGIAPSGLAQGAVNAGIKAIPGLISSGGKSAGSTIGSILGGMSGVPGGSIIGSAAGKAVTGGGFDPMQLLMSAGSAYANSTLGNLFRTKG